MNPRKPAPPGALTLAFVLEGRGGPYAAALALLAGEGRETDLSPDERQAAAAFHPNRRIGFVAGRAAAKQAVAALLAEPVALPALHIANGALEQPVLSGPGTGPLDASLSHGEGLAMAAAFPRGCPMGVDVEFWPGADLPTLKSQMTEAELSLFGRRPGEPEALSLMRLWCLKEALSKVLRTGLTFSFSELEIADLAVEGQVARARFSRFGQYRGLAVTGGAAMTALVLPRLLTGEPDVKAWSAFL